LKKKNGLNDVFDKIYCINLDKRTDRWEVASGQFERFNIDVERFSAIEHENGYMGCKLSHLNVIRDAQKNGYENIFIFEDDVLLNGEFNGNVSKVLDELKGFDWELFYLGGNVSLSTEKNKISNHLFRTNSVLTTHAYGINKSIFSKIISESENMAPISGYLRGDAIDVYYTHAVSKKLKSIITMPMLCTQLDGYSDIEKRDMSYNHIIK